MSYNKTCEGCANILSITSFKNDGENPLRLVQKDSIIADYELAIQTKSKEIGSSSVNYKSLELVMAYEPIGGN